MAAVASTITAVAADKITEASSLAPTATPSEEGSSKCESISSETAADAPEELLTDIFVDSSEDEEDGLNGTPSKSARRRLRRKRQRDAIRAAALQKSLEDVGSNTRDRSNKVVTLGDLGLELSCGGPTPQAGNAASCQMPASSQWRSQQMMGQQAMTMTRGDSNMHGGYRPVPTPINPLAPPQSPHFTGSTFNTPFHGASPQCGCASTTTASTYVPTPSACSSTPSSLCRKGPAGALEVIGTSPHNNIAIRGDASSRAAPPAAMHQQGGNSSAMSPMAPGRVPQGVVGAMHFQQPPACTPMAAASAASPIMMSGTGKPPMMPTTPSTPYAAAFLPAAMPRPWFTAPAAPATPMMPQTQPTAADAMMSSPARMAAQQQQAQQTAAPADALRLLLGGPGGVPVSPQELVAKLQAATPDVYED